MKKIKGVLVKPHQRPVVIEIEPTLENLHKAVDGYIERFYPFPDRPFLGCWLDEEGKLKSKPVNKFIVNEEGYIVGTLAGDILFTGMTPEGTDTSLTDSEIEYLMERYEKDEGLSYKRPFRVPYGFDIKWDTEPMYIDM